MFVRIRRFIIALAFALLATGATLIVVQAQGPTPTSPADAQDPNAGCTNCHYDYGTELSNGLHGQAGNDPIFQKSWTDQGQPGACLICHATGYDPTTATYTAEGVTCESCHGPANPNHPKEPMPVDNTPDLCGRCHSDTRFGWTDWQGSAHYQRGMDCTVCHDPHSAGMKSVQGVSNTPDASALCENCHKDAMKNFPSSKHAEAGVTCVNCHLGFNVDTASTDPNAATDITQAHKAPDHSFLPTLDTCNKCHSTQMHAPGESMVVAAIKIEEAGGTPTPEPTPVTLPTSSVSDQPGPVSPIGYAGLAGLVGLAAGMVLAPWLERFYRRVAKQRHEENSDE